MTTKQQLLTLLKNGDVISGVTLAQKLNLSRNAIWKTIAALKEEGFVITATKQGYQLQQQPLTLNAHSIKEAFPNQTVFVYDAIDSTNTQAKKYADQLTTDFAIFVSDYQSNGRGRYNRTFFSPKGSGLYLSILYPAKSLTDYIHLITPLAAVALHQAITELTGKIPGIKWVNDLFLDGKKISGILTEAITNVEIGQIQYLVIGIGVNVQQPEKLPQELIDIVGYISDVPINVNTLAITIINRVITALQQLPNIDFLNDYRNHSIVLGKTVTVQNRATDSTFIAKALDITNSGHLIVEKLDGTIEQLFYGEVSVKI